MENSDIKIKIASSTSQSFKVATDLRGGNALSPILFNRVLEMVIRDINISEVLILGQSKIGLLICVDDIAIIGDSVIVKKHNI